MSKKSISLRGFIAPCRGAFTFIEVLLVLAIIALFCLCFVGYFLAGKPEALKPPVLKPAVKVSPPPATPAPAAAPPAEPAP